jgi:hypothetical protein
MCFMRRLLRGRSRPGRAESALEATVARVIAMIAVMRHVAIALVVLASSLAQAQSSGAQGPKLNHVHVSVRDLKATTEWFGRVWLMKPAVLTPEFAFYSQGGFALMVEKGDHDSVATIGFVSTDCDQDYKAALDRGAESLEPPTNRAWGTRQAYLKGPGGLRFEIEQPLRK